MEVEQLENLKREIEEYRKLLEDELKTDKGPDHLEKVIKLSQNLDELIVRYEHAIRNNNEKR
ncbi:MAG: aspartyl-phosphate phosphatase Spo0E family protein [Clostridia bacterium]|jgi:hypothetical protein|nr:Spo0E family sporulation regulatory protein-aspartic acid phosphatase [Clostridiales bacterium]